MATRSIRAAAEALAYSPASVSQQVSQLQRDTQITLIARAGRGIEPTTAGLALAARIDSLLDEIADVDAFITGLRDGQHDSLTICYFSSLGVAWIPAILATLNTEFPHTQVNLHVRDAFSAEARPRADLQLVATQDLVHPPQGYTAHELATDAYVVALPIGHPLATEPHPIPLAQLQHERWVDTNAGHGSCRQIALDACAAAGFRPALHVQAQDYATAMALVAAGIGIAVLPGIGAATPPEGVQIKNLRPPAPARRITALLTQEKCESDFARRALGLLRHTAKHGTPTAQVTR